MLERKTVGGLELEFDTERGTIRTAGNPAIFIWTESTMAGLFSGLQRMVGAERIRLSLHGGGRDGVEQDWAYICKYPTFEEGFAELIKVAAFMGWGRWELLSLDRKAKQARMRVYDHWEAICQKVLGVSWGSSYLGGKLAGIFQRLFEVPQCWSEQVRFVSKGDAYDEFVIQPSDASLEDRIERLLATDEATKADLAVALERVRKEVEERAATERELREKLDVIARQDEAIRALSTPIIEVWDGTLALPVIGTVDRSRAARMTLALLDAIAAKQAEFAILDLTGVTTVDEETANHLLDIAKAASLLGSDCLVSGVAPAVARTLVELGAIEGATFKTFATLQSALRHALGRRGVKVSKR